MNENSSRFLKPTLSVALLLALVVLGSGLLGKKQPDLGFYFWRTRWQLSGDLQKRLDGIAAQKIYLRYFDVRWDESTGQAFPDAVVRFEKEKDLGRLAFKVVPVVFLTNSVFTHLPEEGSADLARRVWNKVETISNQAGIRIPQLQLDCDWTDSTRRSYFKFLETLHALSGKRGVELSATIRLHQIKYAQRTGIPPVARGMLMFYNMGQLRAEQGRSSIYNEEDAARYVAWVSRYPLPMDLALPIFSWMVHRREGRVIGLIEKTRPEELEKRVGGDPALEPDPSGRFIAKRSFFAQGTYFRQGDILTLEATGPATTWSAARQVASAGRFGTVTFFDLDERNLHAYSDQDFRGIRSLF